MVEVDQEGCRWPWARVVVGRRPAEAFDVDSTDWRHALLQLEVHRALRSPGTAITFKPEITASRNKADLMITPSEGSPLLVETTSLARADVDQAWEEHEHNVWQAVTTLEPATTRASRWS